MKSVKEEKKTPSHSQINLGQTITRGKATFLPVNEIRINETQANCNQIKVF